MTVDRGREDIYTPARTASMRIPSEPPGPGEEPEQRIARAVLSSAPSAPIQTKRHTYVGQGGQSGAATGYDA